MPFQKYTTAESKPEVVAGEFPKMDVQKLEDVRPEVVGEPVKPSVTGGPTPPAEKRPY